MKKVGIVKIVHGGDLTRKEYVFENPEAYNEIESGTRVVVQDNAGIHIGTCVSDSMIVSENDVKKFTNGNALTGKILGVFIALYDYRFLKDIAERISDVLKIPQPTYEAEDEVR